MALPRVISSVGEPIQIQAEGENNGMTIGPEFVGTGSLVFDVSSHDMKEDGKLVVSDNPRFWLMKTRKECEELSC